ncbi:endolytic transglycosylase MltG, partial [bacterium]
MKRNQIILLCFLILIVLYNLFFGIKARQFEKILVFGSGISTNAIAKKLEDNGVIKSAIMFKIYIKLINAGEHLKAGTYMFTKPLSVAKAAEKILKGETHLLKITIPEGFSAKQIAQRLAEQGFGDYDKFMDIIEQNKWEGYLYPETYVLNPDRTEYNILKVMVDSFHREIFPLFENYDFSKYKKLSYKFDKKNAVILASLVEREAKVPSERARISAVFHNRLKRRWYLESCATVQYILGKPKANLYFKDLEIESPYNTYKHIGLPPGPICSPGKLSVYAALHPSDEDVMFFVRNGDENGGHTFTRYFSQHVKAKK